MVINFLKNIIIFMKNIKFILIISVVLFGLKGNCNDIIVGNFDSLVNTQYQDGDVVTFTSGFTSEGNIGNIFPNINNITFYGNNYIINGDNIYSGFIVNSQADFNSVDMSHCKGQTLNNSSYAGAVLNNGGNVHINYAAFSNNFADASGLNFSYGGAIYNTNGGITDIDTVLFENNYVYGGLATGGAVSNGAYNNNRADMSINNSIFRNNYAHGSVNAEGGALYNSGRLNITASTFSDNTVSGDSGTFLYGGAIYNTGEITIDDVRLLNNKVNNDEEAFAPLDFYMYSLGVTIIEYWDNKTQTWEIL